jgi:hypothetical protein
MRVYAVARGRDDVMQGEHAGRRGLRGACGRRGGVACSVRYRRLSSAGDGCAGGRVLLSLRTKQLPLETTPHQCVGRWRLRLLFIGQVAVWVAIHH